MRVRFGPVRIRPYPWAMPCPPGSNGIDGAITRHGPLGLRAIALLVLASLALLVGGSPTPALAAATDATLPKPASTQDSTTDAAEKPLRVAVIGASASAGFGCVFREKRDDGDYAGSFRLIDMVRLACPDLRLVTSDMSSGFFFLSPIANGEKAATRARDFKPDCVIALDFLFWYCYGDDAPGGGAITDESQRLAKLELGLKQLEAFSVPVLVGDIPDMSRAVGKMLSAAQVPSAATLRKANARFNEWAKGRANVRIVPLANMQQQLSEENALDIGGTRLESKPDAPLLQSDELHPAPHGMAGIACAVASELKQAVGSERIAAEAKDCEPEPVGTVERARGELKPSRRPAPAAKPADSAK